MNYLYTVLNGGQSKTINTVSRQGRGCLDYEYNGRSIILKITVETSNNKHSYRQNLQTTNKIT